jgi:biotin carboxyl carrier protein
MAEEAGVVVRFLVENEDLVEAGQDVIVLGD